MFVSVSPSFTVTFDGYAIGWSSLQYLGQALEPPDPTFPDPLWVYQGSYALAIRGDLLTGTVFEDDTQGGGGDRIPGGVPYPFSVNFLVTPTEHTIPGEFYFDDANGPSSGVTFDLYLAGRLPGQPLSAIGQIGLVLGTGADDTFRFVADNRRHFFDGQGGHDSFTGGDGADTFFGGTGNDTFEGRGGTDRFEGGEGTDTASYSLAIAGVVARLDPAIAVGLPGFSPGGDTAGDTLLDIENLLGSAFADRLLGDDVANTLTGGNGNDYLVGMAGGDALHGSEGVDGAAYWFAAAGVTADLLASAGTAGEAAGDRFDSIENLLGSAHADHLSGNGGANALVGNGGDDILIGRGGADLLVGGAGFDTASYADAPAAVTVRLLVPALNTGDAAGDRHSGIEGLDGSAFNDTLAGSNGADRIEGGSGHDTLCGFGGADTMMGGNGLDKFNGGTGNDTLTGGADADVFFGANAMGRDRIMDWQNGTDKINLASVSGVNGFGDLTVVASSLGAFIYWGTGVDGFYLAGQTVGVVDATDFVF
jgi:Ca2+-binding RTX toxin-like protein